MRVSFAGQRPTLSSRRRIDRVLERLDRWATGRAILVLAAAFFLFPLVLFPAAVGNMASLSGGEGPLDVLFSFSADEAYSRIEAYGPDARRFYAKVELTIDVAFPTITAFLFSFIALFYFRRAFPGSMAVRRLALVPFGAMGADLLENAGIVVLLTSYPSRLDTVARLTSLVVTLKWLLVATTVSVALFAVGAALRRRFLDDTGGD